MNTMSLRSYLRFHTALQLSLALESAEETLVGGQAVLEGVMMRAPHAWGIAIRKPDGELAVHSEPLVMPRFQAVRCTNPTPPSSGLCATGDSAAKRDLASPHARRTLRVEGGKTRHG